MSEMIQLRSARMTSHRTRSHVRTRKASERLAAGELTAFPRPIASGRGFAASAQTPPPHLSPSGLATDGP